MEKLFLLIIPFFDEAHRFKEESLLELLNIDEFHIVMVNDGSNDSLPRRITQLAQSHQNLSLVSLSRNSGKAEALRHSFIQYANSGYKLIGFTDADFSTPTSEIVRLFSIAANISDERYAVFATRDAYHTPQIKTILPRRVAGRAFQFLTNCIFRMDFQDLQCGMKIFSANLVRTDLLNEAFLNQWLFDIEFLLRMKETLPKVFEVRLLKWKHEPGSKVRFTHSAKLCWSIFLLWRHYGHFYRNTLLVRRLE